MAYSVYPLFYHKVFESEPVLYDKIVDDSDFKRSLELERNARIVSQGQGAQAVGGVFDYPDGGIDDKKTPSSLELELRSGRLDKADIDTISRVVDDVAKKEKSDSDDKKKSDSRKKVSDARQAHMDSLTGFDPSRATSAE